MYATDKDFAHLANTLTPAELKQVTGWAAEMCADVAQQIAQQQVRTGKVDPFLLEQQQELAALIGRLGLAGLR